MLIEERIREKQVKVDKLEEQHEHIQQSCSLPYLTALTRMKVSNKAKYIKKNDSALNSMNISSSSVHMKVFTSPLAGKQRSGRQQEGGSRREGKEWGGWSFVVRSK